LFTEVYDRAPQNASSGTAKVPSATAGESKKAPFPTVNGSDLAGSSTQNEVKKLQDVVISAFFLLSLLPLAHGSGAY